MRMPRTLSPSQRTEMTRASDVSDARSTWLAAAALLPTGRVANHGLLDHGPGRRRTDDEGERVDEIVGIDPSVESDELRAFDRKRDLMVEAARSGVECLLQGRLELDLTQAAIAVSGSP